MKTFVLKEINRTIWMYESRKRPVPQSKSCKDAEARIKNLLFSFNSLPVSGGHRGPVLSEWSLFHNSLQRTQKKEAFNDGNKYLFTWITEV